MSPHFDAVPNVLLGSAGSRHSVAAMSTVMRSTPPTRGMFRTDMDTPSPALYELATVPYCELGQSMSWSPEYAAAWQCRANDPTRLWNTHRSSRFEQDDNTCVCRHLANIASASRTK